jgi:hypothetical protein
MRRHALLALAACALAGAACGRQHLTSGFGKATRAAFAAQPVVADPQARPTQALDTQEADVVTKSYVRSLSGEKRAEEPESILYVAPQRGPPQRERVAPSVPKE